MTPSSAHLVTARIWRRFFPLHPSPSRENSVRGLDHGVVRAGFPAQIRSTAAKSNHYLRKSIRCRSVTVPASWLGWVIGEKDEMVKLLARELKNHAPFTALGSVTGIAIMVVVVFGKVSYQISQGIFYTLHPLHVLLSALVTTAIFKRHSQGKLLPAIVIGYSGSIGIATISDSLIPYVGGVLLGVEMEFHIGFIEKWWFVNPLALAGITIGYLRPTTKFPHSGHVLLSTWASLFYLTAFGVSPWIPLLHFVFIFLFLAVWLPCCISDIVFPLLFTPKIPLRRY